MKHAIIIGAGPAGLTAALELLRRTDIKPIVLEADDCVGGISRTVNYHGNRIDIGGHRFFSKSNWVMSWWQAILPIQTATQEKIDIAYHGQTRAVITENSAALNSDQVMLIRGRLSRIYYLRKFFDYPISLSLTTIRNLGLIKLFKIGVSYTWAQLFPRHPEKSLEDFLFNRFGRELYLTFFKDYTEKVWGIACQEIAAEWGAQRIKGLSVITALRHALAKLFKVSVKKVNTSLIERFLYPKFGPGQMWEAVAQQILARGGVIHFNHQVRNLYMKNGNVIGVQTWNNTDQQLVSFGCDYVFSTMPVRDLVGGLGDAVPDTVQKVAAALPYRDFITVGLLAKTLRANPQSCSTQSNHMPPDNWIYIQESDVKVGRLQIFNNWSSGMVADPNKIWMGLEYFCNEGDELWRLSDAELINLGTAEMEKIGLLNSAAVEDCIVIRMPKAYPAYFGSYSQFNVIRDYLDAIPNLFLIGRNGMHRYNNQDHSMLTAKLAVDNIIAGITDKSNIWAINVDDDYHEETATDDAKSTHGS